MNRFAQKIFIASGLRTPFGRGGGALADHDAISLSVPLAWAMASRARPDLFVWGTVIPSLGWSNIGREVWLDAGLDPTVPAFSAVLACSTSMIAAFAAAGMLGGASDLALVGGAEVMSNPPIGLKLEVSKRITKLFRQNPAEAFAALQSLTPDDLTLPTKGWANRITGRSMGDHMEETAKIWSIGRETQDRQRGGKCHQIEALEISITARSKQLGARRGMSESMSAKQGVAGPGRGELPLTL